MKQATLKWASGFKPQITVEHLTRSDNFILKLSGLPAFFRCLLWKRVVSETPTPSLLEKRTQVLVGSHRRGSTVFQLQDPEQAPQPLRRATASPAKSMRAVSPLQGCSVLRDMWIVPNYKGSEMFFFQLTFGNIMISWVWWFWCFALLAFEGWRAGDLEWEKSMEEGKDISIQISDASIITWQNCSGKEITN